MAHRPNILKLATKISLESLTYTGITEQTIQSRGCVLSVQPVHVVTVTLPQSSVAS